MNSDDVAILVKYLSGQWLPPEVRAALWRVVESLEFVAQAPQELKRQDPNDWMC